MDKTKIAVDIFDKYARFYQDKFMDVSSYHDSFDLFCDQITKENAEILELACGPGNITQYLLQKRPDFKILGTDLSPNMIALAGINNPTATFALMDCRDIGKSDKSYDGIMCGFALPYLSKEEAIQLIRDASGILNPSGVLYISTMEDDYSKSGFRTGSQGDQIFMHFHQADYLIQALDDSGFTLIDLQRVDIPEQEGSAKMDMLLIAVKND
jgi:predicted TPR repeat methyltransferase